MGLLSAYAGAQGGLQGLLGNGPVNVANPQLAGLLASLLQAHAGGSTDTSGIGSPNSPFAAPMVPRDESPQQTATPEQMAAPPQAMPQADPSMGGPAFPTTPPPRAPHGLLATIFSGAADEEYKRRQADYQNQMAQVSLQNMQTRARQIAATEGPDMAQMFITQPDVYKSLHEYHNNAEGSSYMGPDGQYHISPKSAITPSGVPTVFNDSGLHTAPQLPGEKAIDPGSGQVLDKNLGLTDQSVPVPQKYAPGETPAVFGGLNMGSGGGGAFGSNPIDMPQTPPSPPRLAPPGRSGTLTPDQSAALSANPAQVFSQILGGRVAVNSAVRTPVRNLAVGGSPTSEHLSGNGQAYDIQLPPGMSHQDAIAKIRAAGLPVDQFGIDGGALHVGFRPPGISGRNSMIGGPSYNVAANAPRRGQPGFSGVTVGQPVGGGFKIMKGSEVQGGDPNLDYKVSPTGDITPMARSFTMDNVLGNRKEFYGSEQYKSASGSLAPIQGLFDTVSNVAPGGVVGMAALDTLNKALNPSGAVRPQTVQLFLDELGLPESIKSHISGVVGNGPLSPEVVKQIGRAAWSYGKAHVDQAQARADGDAQLAIRNGYRIEDVGETVPPVPKAPAWMQDPKPAKPQVGKVYWSADGPWKYTGPEKGYQRQ